MKDEAYNFPVDPDIIAMIEKISFMGENINTPLNTWIILWTFLEPFGKDEVKQHYYFLKLFPFSLGGASRDWYNSLEQRSIASKDE
jgi:hypothetical protein